MAGTELVDLTKMEVDCGWEHFTGKTSIVLQHKRHTRKKNTLFKWWQKTIYSFT